MKKIMKNLKKIPALLMLVLSIVMTIPNVYALDGSSTGNASTIDEDGNSITISGIEDLDKSNVTITVYHLIDTNIENGAPKTPVYTWVDEVAEWLSTSKYASYILEDTTNVVDPSFCATSEDTEVTCLTPAQAKAFYDDLANAIRSGDIDLDPEHTYAKEANTEEGILAFTDVDGKTKIGSLTMGNKLILIEGGMNVYRPTAINIVPEYDETDGWGVVDTDLVVKYTTPSIDKTVEGAENGSAQIGDTVNYKLKVTIPVYPDNALAKTIIISDKFDNGLTFDTTSVVVKANTEDNETSATTLTKDTNYLLDTEATDEYTFKITITDEMNATLVDEDEVPYRYLYVTYKGTINENAIVTECTEEENEDGETVTVCPTTTTNTATLKYNNNPYDDSTWEDDTEDKVTVYTYGIRLDKIDEDLDDEGNTVYLPGAKFTIKDSNGNLINFVADATKAGVYHKAISAAEAAANADLTATPESDLVEDGILEVSEDGRLEVTGLAVGTYTVTEVEAPAEYIKLQNPITITITDSNVNGLVEEDGADTDSGYAFTEVPNSNDMHVLPVTGGMGTILFSVIGIMFMGLGAFLIRNIFKKEEEVQ